MMTLIYRLIVLIIVAFIAWELFSQKDIKSQATAAMVLIPLIMRALMIA